ncbi:MAG: GGDEF domain-containing protein [Desulfobacterales bacterium]|nr:GGDEF domain-containing protein [Desulfobacterales bacterium]
MQRFKDITERKYAENTLKEANERLELLSTLDGLTGVDNRRSFDQTIQKEWARMQRTKDFLSLIMCDVDFFKLFNDTYGHQSGDDCLKSVARAMKGIARRGGDCVARYGGEEFAVILPVTGKKALFILRKRFDKPWKRGRSRTVNRRLPLCHIEPWCGHGYSRRSGNAGITDQVRG